MSVPLELRMRIARQKQRLALHIPHVDGGQLADAMAAVPYVSVSDT